jgi:hypothetical protein
MSVAGPIRGSIRRKNILVATLRCSPKTMPVEMREYPITGVWFWMERVLS